MVYCSLITIKKVCEVEFAIVVLTIVVLAIVLLAIVLIANVTGVIEHRTTR